ncbi:hypothetical protein PLANTIT3_60215 [Plantibacter sp. T3]|nr:hypothetical protein PLANTIT3_60215 [Plantibacter sp. T3]
MGSGTGELAQGPERSGGAIPNGRAAGSGASGEGTPQAADDEVQADPADHDPDGDARRRRPLFLRVLVVAGVHHAHRRA